MDTLNDFGQLGGVLGDDRTAITIGVFDGMHLGHQALVRELVAQGQQASLRSLVITFPDHPLSLLAPPYCPKKLIYPDRKAAVLQLLGVDLVAEVPFTQRFASWEPEAFVEQVLVRQCRVSVLVCGYDFSFGKAGAGNIELLKQLGEKHGFVVSVVDAVADHDVLVKSTQIRDLLFNGEVERAAHLLTRPYELRGKVITGYQRGRTIGFPTANLDAGKTHVIPAVGVYLCGARVEGQSEIYAAMVNVGHNPTFGLDHLSIEAHLLDFDGELPGCTLGLHFLRRLREERKFPSVDALVEQLQVDRLESRNLLETREISEQLANI